MVLKPTRRHSFLPCWCLQWSSPHMHLHLSCQQLEQLGQGRGQEHLQTRRHDCVYLRPATGSHRPNPGRRYGGARWDTRGDARGSTAGVACYWLASRRGSARAGRKTQEWRGWNAFSLWPSVVQSGHRVRTQLWVRIWLWWLWFFDFWERRFRCWDLEFLVARAFAFTSVFLYIFFPLILELLLSLLLFYVIFSLVFIVLRMYLPLFADTSLFLILLFIS